ncbi:hypothetical protein LTR78_000574 [Recurvomyces mirabilis]|uniref:Uncharacterized protein n=1 Tax=Recurvomyces mirabilis TaxID=574656 RepID=A0AAE0WXZ4_9PEZI|nr:hypothetical protein LTR78_000574 [Recurvomyces mirabilis]KAK5162229.1 hypothetical protein LTS14_000575 [Recurvomyces mirabilis]
MGQSQSTRRSATTKTDGKRSPSQEKHTSADSSTPFAVKAADLDIDRSTITEKHSSYGGTTATRSRANTMSFGSTMVGSTTLSLGIDDMDGHADVSRPPPPPRIRHLSELIDPAELPIDAHVRSPSGHLLAPEQFLVHPDRPLSMRERQEEIREKMRSASRMGVEAEPAVAQMPSPPKSKKRKGCRNCFRA